eukprot:TRINITY_DN49324_c0_g1_i1.p1 TRINITY_DN49324_c0_g1~~TRINITY_DN49324_c0_g1_i1.p1  ORF type:complete len:392 (-),score=45.27 TRINITY_DN49324_c0_g1_i1:393-1568(-)
MAHSGESFEEKLTKDQLVNLEDPVDEFICSICLHVVGSCPKLTKCSHLFCGDCLDKWFEAQPSSQSWAQRAKAGGAIPCPTCKTTLHKHEDVFVVSKDGDSHTSLLWHMISALQVKCHKTQDRGCCSWKGVYADYWDHLHNGTCGQVLDESIVGAMNASQTDVLEPTCNDKDNPMASSLKTSCESREHMAANALGSCSSTDVGVFDSPAHSEDSLDRWQKDTHEVCSEFQSLKHEGTMEQADHAPEEDLHSLLRKFVDIKLQEYKSDALTVVQESDTVCTSSAKAGDTQNCDDGMNMNMAEPSSQRRKGRKTMPSKKHAHVATHMKARPYMQVPFPDSRVQAAYWQAYQSHVAQAQAMQYQQLAMAYRYQVNAHITAMMNARNAGGIHPFR